MTALARMSCGTALAACVALALGSAAIAQDWYGWQGFRTRREAPRFAVPGDFDGGFNFCRIMYTSGRREAGGQGWWTDYPDADHHLSIRLSQMTTMGAPRARSARWCCASARSPAMGPAGSRSKCRTMARRGAGCSADRSRPLPCKARSPIPQSCPLPCRSAPGAATCGSRSSATILRCGGRSRS